MYIRGFSMPGLRVGRRKYYDLFSYFYDAFIRLHARQDAEVTRHFLVDAAQLETKAAHSILDVCCGTGSVVLAFGEHCPDALIVGYDFSHGMLRKAQEKNVDTRTIFVEGDAAELPFPDNSFDVVSCSHALYELKGHAREKALWEMKRVIQPAGVVLLIEHEVPSHFFVKFLFNVRMISMGSDDAREFVEGGMQQLRKIFSRVNLRHSQSGKSRLTICKK
ncbi:MAG: methyltransferase domain-containing protein [Syntrophobacterales bacterium]|jgi:ubiquinone/menaquinone biosynthesis C-methylase UbiE